MKKTIVVCGLLPGQVSRMVKTIGDGVKLKFVDASRVTARFPSGDHCVILTKFCGHRWTNLALKDFPRDNVHYHVGGMKDLTILVNGLASGKLTVGLHSEQRRVCAN